MKALRLVVLAGLSACSGGTSPNDGGSTVNCQNSPIMNGSTIIVPPYQPGMAAMPSDGGVQVLLVESNPAPPTLDTNTWTLQVNDASGSPMPSASISIPAPYMPFHGHYSDQTPSVTQGSNGQWTASDIYFFMDGVWQTTVNVTNGSTQSTVAFYLCVEG